MIIKNSEEWNTWITRISQTTCGECKELNGKIFYKFESFRMPPIHPYCRCKVERLKAIIAGTVTEIGSLGADWFLYYKRKLPYYYITKSQAEMMGWDKKKGNLGEIARGKMIGGEIYFNDDKKITRKIWTYMV